MASTRVGASMPRILSMRVCAAITSAKDRSDGSPRTFVPGATSLKSATKASARANARRMTDSYRRHRLERPQVAVGLELRSTLLSLDSDIPPYALTVDLQLPGDFAVAQTADVHIEALLGNFGDTARDEPGDDAKALSADEVSRLLDAARGSRWYFFVKVALAPARGAASFVASRGMTRCRLRHAHGTAFPLADSARSNPQGDENGQHAHSSALPHGK
jgi:hypothetical protein